MEILDTSGKCLAVAVFSAAVFAAFTFEKKTLKSTMNVEEGKREGKKVDYKMSCFSVIFIFRQVPPELK